MECDAKGAGLVSLRYCLKRLLHVVQHTNDAELLYINVVPAPAVLYSLPARLFQSGAHNTIVQPRVTESCHGVFFFVFFLCIFQSEDIRLEPELHSACKKDIERFCSAVSFGNAQVSSGRSRRALMWGFVCHGVSLSFINKKMFSL